MNEAAALRHEFAEAHHKLELAQQQIEKLQKKSEIAFKCWKSLRVR